MTHNLSSFHTFHLNAQAIHVAEVHSVAQLLAEWQLAQQEKQPILLLGQGSNVLFLEDFAGVVLLNRLKGIAHHQDENFHYLHVQGGENWHELVQWTLAHHIAGLENLALIPGCVGSAPIQNIGAYGVEFERYCDFVEVLNLQSGEQFRLNREQCAFGYRESVFKQQYREHYAIIVVGLKLPKAWQPMLSYGSLANLDPQAVTPEQIFAEVCDIRRKKLPNPDECGNAGSFFKNPIVEQVKFQALQANYPNMPFYLQADGSVKLAAGWLIEQCGLKGQQIGGAAVHTEQALVLVNKTNATGADVLALAKSVRHQVREKFGVEITPEVRFIGAQGEIDSEAATR